MVPGEEEAGADGESLSAREQKEKFNWTTRMFRSAGQSIGEETQTPLNQKQRRKKRARGKNHLTQTKGD